MNFKKIYNKIEVNVFDSKYPVFSSVNDGQLIGIKTLDGFNKEWFRKSSDKISKFFKKVLNIKKYNKKLIYVYDNIDMYWNVCHFNDDTGYAPDSKFVKKGLFYTKISEDKDVISVHDWKFYVKEINISDFTWILDYDWEKFSNSYCEIMFAMNFYLHINEEIIMYGHIDYSFWFIDITWKNWDLMKELLKDFIEIEWLTWYANDLWKNYIKENKINIIPTQ